MVVADVVIVVVVVVVVEEEDEILSFVVETTGVCFLTASSISGCDCERDSTYLRKSGSRMLHI